MKYRVYIEQVNATFIEVEAKDKGEARDKAYRKWRREYAHSEVTEVSKITEEGSDERV